MRKYFDPVAAAQALRTKFIKDIPKTWEQYYQRGNMINAHQMARLIQEQCADTLTFEDAALICAQVNPELTAEYWNNLVYTVS